MMASMSDEVEDDCAVCGSWPASFRPTMRDAIFFIPVKQPICDDCVVAFWDNVGSGPRLCGGSLKAGVRTPPLVSIIFQ